MYPLTQLIFHLRFESEWRAREKKNKKKRCITFEVAASISGLCILLRMQSLVILRMSGGSTTLECAPGGGGPLYTIKKTGNPLTQSHLKHHGGWRQAGVATTINNNNNSNNGNYNCCRLQKGKQVQSGCIDADTSERVDFKHMKSQRA